MQNLKVISIEALQVEAESAGRLLKTGPEEESIRRVMLPQVISLQGGELFIDGAVAPSCFIRNFFYWERETEEGPQRGCVRLMHHGFLSQGIVEQKGIRQPFTATACNVYHLSYRKDGASVPWCQFKMGVRKDPAGDYVTYGELYIDGKLFDPKYCSVTYSVVEGDLLHADITINKDYLAFTGTTGMCWKASFDFSYHYETCQNGTFYPYIPGEGFLEDPYQLTGECIMDNRAELKSRRLRAPADKEVMHRLKANAGDLIQDVEPSVSDLFSLAAPDMSKVHEASMGTLYNLMLYHCDSLSFEDNGQSAKWITWFNKEKGIVEKSLEPEDIKLLQDTDIKAFLEEYALAILTDMFASSENDTMKKAMSKAKGNPAEKMLFYFKGTGSKGLAQNPKFEKAINAVMQNTYCRFVNGLDKYINSDDPAGWAEKLYNRCLKSIEQLRVQRLSKDNSRANHLSMILHFLDQQKRISVSAPPTAGTAADSTEEKLTYAVALYGQVLNNSLAEVIEQWRHDDQKSMITMMRKILEVYVNQLLYSTSLPLESEALAELKKELQDMSLEYGLSTEEEIVDKSVELAEEFITMAVDRVDLPLSALFQKGRLYVCITACMCPLFFCGREFANWDKLDDLHKADYIVNFTVASMNIFCSVNTLTAFKTLASDTASIEAKINAALRLKFSGISLEIIENISASSGQTVTETMINAGRYTADAAATAEGTAVQISKWTRFSLVAEVAIRIFNIIAMGLAIFLVSMDIAREYKDKYMWDSIKGVDIVQDICIGVSAILEIAALTLDALSIACSAMPIIGGIVAVIGIVFAIVSIILHSKYKPKTIVEAFIEQRVLPFVDELESPDAAWLAENRPALSAGGVC